MGQPVKLRFQSVSSSDRTRRVVCCPVQSASIYGFDSVGEVVDV